ncbi:methyltransferase domain-containing protein [Lysinibacillus fusiformis]|uniref:class I SAM-dependent methyltransferase n=1 Tax=Lysinibacillus fusiformis TaxID=28031 RepID=UPI00196828FB|nr:rRNA adenine N-6-methyltransferase family protein [Lysinibacillus fusiformis]QSB08724.1 methyltransferase domain-containing protein [Lysinibacillus fusiformis]
MKNLLFIFQYIFNPRSVGAILPSSKYLSKKMINDINFEKAKYIVEYGPGTGIFTENIIKNKKTTTKVVLIENNKNFYTLLQEKYKNVDNTIIVYDSAENVESILMDNQIPYVDYIVSGLPFTSLPINVSNKILQNTLKVLKEDGLFVTFQYTKLKIPFFKKYFPDISIKKEYRNLPPAYILNCYKFCLKKE